MEAIMDFSASDQHFAQLHDFESTALPEAIIRRPSRFSEDERQIIALSHHDHVASTRDDFDWSTRLARFFAGGPAEKLANGKLEELRRFAVLVREYGEPDDADTERFLDAGYTPAHVARIRQALKQTAPPTVARHRSLMRFGPIVLLPIAVYFATASKAQSALLGLIAAVIAFVALVRFAAPGRSRSPRQAGLDEPDGAGANTDASSRRLPRLLLLATMVLLVSGAALSFQPRKHAGVAVAEAMTGSSDDIVVLADGATVVASRGSRDRAMADWLNGASKSGHSLTLATDIFEARSARLTEPGIGDAAKLATILQATPDARILIIGRGDPHDDPGNGQLIGQMRSDALASFLEDRGISADQIRTASSDEPVEASHGQIRLVAWRGLTRRDFQLASR